MKHWNRFIFCLTAPFLVVACSCNNRIDDGFPNNPMNEKDESSTLPDFFYGADLSYVNEMEDCGAVYFDADNNQKDVYEIFADQGANLARYRLWHNPTWTDYSNLSDVKKSIRRAKDKGLYVLLDFHYSDTWADPGKQTIPAAWLSLIDDTPALAQELYDYTYEVLDELQDEGLTPDIVQVGNEINPMILQREGLLPMDWNRNATLLNEAIKAVRDFSTDADKTVEIMLHIAQPENGLWWFEQATNAGVADYDWIGISYYPEWSDYTLENLQTPLQSLVSDYGKKLMVVETAYPFTLDYADTKNNLFDDSSLLDGYPATQEGQFAFLTELVSVTKNAGGAGVVYWEPAWISTSCRSAWENSTLLDFAGKPTKGMRFYNQSFSN